MFRISLLSAGNIYEYTFGKKKEDIQAQAPDLQIGRLQKLLNGYLYLIAFTSD